MIFSRLCFCAVLWMTLTIHVIQAMSLENDISTKLAELTKQMIKMSGQLSKVSEQVQEHDFQLSKLSEQQLGQSGQLDEVSNHFDEVTNKVTELTNQYDATENRLHTLETNAPDDVTNIDVISQIKELEQKMQASSSGPVFVRWGRKTCNGTDSDIIYTGVAGGSPTVHPGGGADILCLPRDPSYANHNTANDLGSNIMVAEYKLDPTSNFPFENNDPLLLDEDVPCAVCEGTNASSVMMIPARVDCYSGWRLEYRGYLMTEISTSVRSQFVCVDENPEVDYGGSGTATYTVGLYPVETHCEYLPCPPFESQAEAACVVCSK